MTRSTPLSHIFLGLILILLLPGARAHAISNALEPYLAEASIAFRAGQLDKALGILDAALAIAPKERELLELKALCLSQTSREAQAAEIYRELIRQAKEGDVPEKTRASYFFELGVIEFRKGSLAKAEEYFSQAIKGNFNVGASRYFLGLAVLSRKSITEAKDHFHAVTEKDGSVLRAAAHAQIARLELDEGFYRRALWHYLRALTHATQRLRNPTEPKSAKAIANHIVDSVDQSISRLTRNHFFGSLSFFAAYDSDVYAPIGGTAAPVEATDISTPKAILQGSFGYSTPPANETQFIGTYEGHGNYNFNKDARTAQFLVHQISLSLNREPLGIFSWGAKADASYAFRWKEDVAGGGEKFGPYNLWASLSPYLSYAVSPRTKVGGNVTFRPQKFYGDVDVDEDSHRSGHDISLKGFVKREEPDSFWNPELSLEGTLSRTSGIEYRSKGVELAIANRMDVTANLAVNVGVGVGLVSYSDRVGEPRTDKIFSSNLGAFYWVTPSFLISAEARYVNDESSISDFRYSRLLTGAGVSVLF